MDPIAPRKRGNPNMVPGAPSVNPTGRPKGAAGLARYIGEQTNGGQELVDRLLTLARNPVAPVREATGAVLALLDRLIGKPLAPSEVSIAVAREDALQLPSGWSQMTPAEREQWALEYRTTYLGRALPAGGA